MQDNCIFCKISNGEIPTDMIYENEHVACFKDNNPQTERHFLLVPKNHYHDLIDLAENGAEDAAHLLAAIPEISKQEDFEESGFRVINNCGKGAGQSVFHVHFHLLTDESKLRETLV